jgi:LAO/AO transport system kinase
MPSPQEWIAQVLRGERRALARAITALENADEAAPGLRAGLAAHLGRAHVVGVTGPPGGGKSTLVSALIRNLRARGLTVAVVAVDPSSPITGGAVLGDRVRMGEHDADEGVFIRSLASRGHLGGLSRTTGDVIDAFDAAGFDIVIVETVGAGQSEVAVTHLADTRLVVCPPGLGDDIQAIKAGILEIADALVVSKADLPQAARTERELHAMLALRGKAHGAVPVLRAIAGGPDARRASNDDGVSELADWLMQRTTRGTRLGSGEARSARDLAARCLAHDGFAAHLGFEFVAAGIGTATVRMQIGAQHVNFNGRCHGGAIFSLADMALGLACNGYGTIAALIDGHISLAAGVEQGAWIVAHAVEVSRSRKIAVYRVDVTRADDGSHIGCVSGTVYRTEKPVVVPE